MAKKTNDGSALRINAVEAKLKKLKKSETAYYSNFVAPLLDKFEAGNREESTLEAIERL